MQLNKLLYLLEKALNENQDPEVIGMIAAFKDAFIEISKHANRLDNELNALKSRLTPIEPGGRDDKI